MKVAKFSIEKLNSSVAFDLDKELEELFTTIKDLLPDLIGNEETINIEFCEMDENEFYDLPEFQGW